MSVLVNGGELGLILCRMFGIDPNQVLEIQVSARVGELASVTIQTRPVFVDHPIIEQTFQLVRNEE